MIHKYKYIILGGGMAGANAATEIRQHDSEGTLLIITKEADKPYHRPPLSKEFWTQADYPKESIYYSINNDKAIDFLMETTVKKINADQLTIEVDNGEVYQYDKLLYALGGAPKWIEGPESDRVFALRTLEDYRGIRQLTDRSKHAIIVGGGWVGAELAAGLKMNDMDVTLVFSNNTLNEKRLPLALAEKFHQRFVDFGVNLINNAKADSYRVVGDKVCLKLEDGRELTTDILILGLGLQPNVDLAKAAGLEVGNGVIANKYLQTSNENIYAAGDVVSYPDLIIGRNRFEHEDQAEHSGQTAGRNMVGMEEVYTHSAPLSYTDVIDISIEGVGEMSRNRDDEIIEEVGNGYIVYYLNQGKPSGILTYNVKVDMDKARDILANPPETPGELHGMLKPL
ncbi:NAD(P)/FAD-dependent oxidoreductase [Fundicoccus culcitae]|uniref:NAD(P)/FAD-dependent oxidoreductase n=1 Tax=Fundicoccus culcitae TaxID=2969821 RepID=A0ABY5P8X5_9LACT|nr:FAD/NAD(P)-binding oxidoreductase [Fundicoccus culcitae]UUX34813.1 NAD(P)/FAD-dependent oxidoreductase [Fundicoccus culcitae]